MKKVISSPLGVAVALLVVLSLAMFTAGAADAGTAKAKVSAPAAATSVAQTAKGQVTSRIVGSTGNGRDVSGSFTPVTFVKRNGSMFARWLVSGVVHERNGATSTFSALRTMRVSSIGGAPVGNARTAQAAQAAATCDILHLVLAPLDLDLLGLQVHLDKVVLNIVAASGAGQLLGNLLCAVTHLLDGGLGGLLGQIGDLLNRILAILRLG